MSNVKVLNGAERSFRQHILNKENDNKMTDNTIVKGFLFFSPLSQYLSHPPTYIVFSFPLKQSLPYTTQGGRPTTSTAMLAVISRTQPLMRNATHSSLEQYAKYTIS